MNYYILNSAVITGPGLFLYERVYPGEARAWLRLFPWDSTIGYEETAQALSQITDVSVPYDSRKRQITMETGDQALVFRLTKRVVNPADKGSMSLDWIKNNCEIGLLRKVPYNLLTNDEDPA